MLGFFDQQQRQRRQAFGCQNVAQHFLADEHRFGVDCLQRVHQRPATDLGIDEAHHHTELDQAKPAAEKRRAVLHGQRADIAGAQATGMKYVSQLVGPGVDLGVAQALIAINDERPLAVALRLFFEAIRQGIAIRRFDPRGSFGPAIKDGLGLFAGHNPAINTGQQACVVIEIVHPYLR